MANVLQIDVENNFLHHQYFYHKQYLKVNLFSINFPDVLIIQMHSNQDLELLLV